MTNNKTYKGKLVEMWKLEPGLKSGGSMKIPITNFMWMKPITKVHVSQGTGIEMLMTR